MSEIEDLRKKHETVKEISEYKFKLSKIKHGWIASIFAFAAAITTVTILVLDRLLEKDLCGHLPTDLKLEIFSTILIITVLYILFNYFSNRKIIKTLVEQHADLVVVMRIFETLSNKLDDNNLKLSKFLSQTETISQNLQNAPVSSLISWHNSELIEIQSKKVWAFSYTLKWLDEKRVLDILKELSDKKDHEYHFILANTDVVARNEKVKSISDKISDFDRINNTNIAARFIVKPVTKGDFLFSIPNDIAIYQDFLEGDKTTSIVVINTEEFCNNNGVIHDKERNFDIRFSELRQVNRIIEWYKKYWSRVS